MNPERKTTYMSFCDVCCHKFLLYMAIHDEVRNQGHSRKDLHGGCDRVELGWQGGNYGLNEAQHWQLSVVQIFSRAKGRSLGGESLT